MKVIYTLQEIQFEWESDKALTNIQKHRVAFEHACEVFFDPFFQQDDDDIVDGEVRERVVGMTEDWQVLYVVYTLRPDAIRIISARRATRQQRKSYETQ
ncbi:MAG: BrnT family toxin [Caldilineaceae bacterium]